MVQVIGKRKAGVPVNLPGISGKGVIPNCILINIVLTLIEEVVCRYFHFTAPIVGIINSAGPRSHNSFPGINEEIHGTLVEAAVASTAHTAHSTSAAHSSPATATALSTPATSAAHHPGKVRHGEILFIDVIQLSQHGYPAAALKPVESESALISCIGTSPGIGTAEVTVPHAATGNNVDGFGGVSVIEAGKARLITHLIEHLNFIHYLCRQIFQRSIGVVSEKRLVIHQNPAHLFSLHIYLAILHRNARHFGQQVLGCCITVGFKS